MVATDNLSRTDRGTGAAKRVPTFDGLRGLCALGVVVFHVAFMAGVSNHIEDKGSGIWGFLTDGLAVCLPPFFVLSGLLLYRSFARSIIAGTRRPPALPFLWKRALRILPAYWVLIAVSVLFLNFYTIGRFWYSVRPFLLLQFFYTNNPLQWLTGTEPTWTVPAEFAFYLGLPVFGWLIDRYARRAGSPAQRVRRMMWPLSILVLVGAGWTAFCFLPAMAPSVWYLNFFPFGYIGFFAGGMMLATLSVYNDVAARPPALYRLVTRWPNLCWLLAAVVFVVNVPKPFGEPGEGTYPALLQEMIEHVLLFLFAVLIVAPLTVPRTRSRLMDAVLTNAPVRFVGRISYGVYLWHVVWIHLWFKNGSIFGHHPVTSVVFRGTVGFWTLLTFVLGGTIVTALVSHYAIEQPAQRLRNRFVGAPRKPVAAVAAEIPEAGDVGTGTAA